MPAFAEDFCKLGDTDEIGPLFQRVEAYGDEGVGGINDDELVAQVFPELALSGIDGPEKKGSGITVKVEEDKASVCLDILKAEMPKKRALAGSGLSQDGNVGSSLYCAQAMMSIRDMAVYDPESQVETLSLAPRSAPPPETVPNCGNEFFKNMEHSDFNFHQSDVRNGNWREMAGPGQMPGPYDFDFDFSQGALIL